ncbi:hypothetical protein [Megamonas funiformis]|uniref:hypothetical protein n=1 Tax=Megamonas funiformis TaxID=437897 RepID=UPI003F7FB0B0
MSIKEEKIYYDYDTKKYVTKAIIEKAIDEMTKKARNQYDALAVFALSQQIPLSQITSQDVLIHFKNFTEKIIAYVIYKELDLITEEKKKKINWSKISWCEPSDLIFDDFDWCYYLTNTAELNYILQK